MVPFGDVGGGLGAVAPAVGLDGPQQDGASPTTSISSSSSWWSGGSGRSGHGYAFHFFAMRQRGMALSRDPDRTHHPKDAHPRTRTTPKTSETEELERTGEKTANKSNTTELN